MLIKSGFWWYFIKKCLSNRVFGCIFLIKSYKIAFSDDFFYFNKITCWDIFWPKNGQKAKNDEKGIFDKQKVRLSVPSGI